MCGQAVADIARRDAIRKAKGEQTMAFHNITPNPALIARYKKSTPPPVLRSLSSSESSSNLGIRRGSGSTRRQDVASSRRTSKSKRFSTTR